MPKGGTALLCCSPFQMWRAHLCKAVIFTLLIFLFLEYACNIVVYKHQINKIVAPGLAWINNLNQKSELDRISTVTKSRYKESQNTAISIIVNKTLTSKTMNKSRSSNNFILGNVTSLTNATSQLETQKECPLVPPNLGTKFCLYCFNFNIICN